MDGAAFDLLLRGGRVVDPGQSLSTVADVGFRAGKVAAVGTGVDAADAANVVDCTGKTVVPGLIDLHTHVYWGGTSLGVDPERLGAVSGATTLVDAGSAGAANIAGFRAHVIAPASVRVLAFLNVSFPGVYAFSRNVMVGETEELRLLSAPDCVEAAREHRDVVVGVKVRVGRFTSGAQGLGPLTVALQVAEELGLPLMTHIDQPPPDLRDVLRLLRAGDILTHCFRPFPNAPIRSGTDVLPEVLDARERGVVFDTGHGSASFSFATAEAMLRAGFLPDVISSDAHALSVDGPAFNLLVTMSKFADLGVPFAGVIERVTAAPARALRRPDLGSLAVGAVGDATILEVVSGEYDLLDSEGHARRANSAIACRGRVVGGEWTAS